MRDLTWHEDVFMQNFFFSFLCLQGEPAPGVFVLQLYFVILCLRFICVIFFLPFLRHFVCENFAYIVTEVNIYAKHFLLLLIFILDGI